MMTEEEMKLFREVKAFFETPAGRLLERFSSRHHTAVMTDVRENATLASMKRDWSASDAALRDLRKEIQRLQLFESQWAEAMKRE